MPFGLRQLPYADSGLEPHFDADWVASHRRWHESYVERLNSLLDDTEWAEATLEGRSMTPTRCGWVPEGDPLYVAYHDDEWGVPAHDERHLFEMLVLEGAQAGLSWATILRKREGYRAAFAGFDPDAVARFGPPDVECLLGDPGIVRNRLKVESAIANAQATLAARDELGGLDAYLWSFVGGAPIRNAWRTLGEIPAEIAESRAMSKDLKRRGFRFVGPTVCYAFMQAVGMVNDHTVDCYRYDAVA